MSNHVSVHVHPAISLIPPKDAFQWEAVEKTRTLQHYMQYKNPCNFSPVSSLRIIFYFTCTLPVGREADTLILIASHSRDRDRNPDFDWELEDMLTYALTYSLPDPAFSEDRRASCP